MSTLENESNWNLPVARNFGVSWPLLVALLGFLGILGIDKFKAVLSDPDTYWHLATGRWIVAHGTVPQSDVFSHSMPGAPWTAHEWLSELVLSGVFSVAGWSGLVVLTALSFAAALAYLNRFLLARMEPAHALLFPAFAAAMLFSHLLARPHVLVWPLLTVWVGTLVDAGEKGRRPPWQLLPLMTLWANLHGSFTLGLALGAALALDAVLACSPGERLAAGRRWTAFVGLSMAAAAISPTGLHGLWYPFQVTGMTVALNAISEWRSPDFHQLQILEIWLLLVLAFACLGRMRLPWLRLLLILGLAHLALKHQRHVEVVGLVTPFLIATPLAFRLRVTKGAGRDVAVLDRVFLALAAPATPMAIGAAALVAALAIGSVLHSDRYAPAADKTPEAALRAAVAGGASGPVLNAYEFGGYLIYNEVPVFIDGRADMYGDPLLKRYLDALQLHGTEDLPRLLEDYHIAWTLLAPGTPAVALLDHLPGWRRLYGDTVAVVHVHVGAAS